MTTLNDVANEYLARPSALTFDEMDWVECVADEMERAGGGRVDREKLAAEMYGDEYDVHDGPLGDDFDAWVQSMERDYGTSEGAEVDF